MTQRILRTGLLVVAIALPWWSMASENGNGLLNFTDGEIRRILQHGPWPAPWSRDPSNRVSGNPEAIALGAGLFFDERLSAKGVLACGSCHVPERDWSDGLERAAGMVTLDRNTPNLVNVRFNRWFG